MSRETRRAYPSPRPALAAAGRSDRVGPPPNHQHDNGRHSKREQDDHPGLTGQSHQRGLPDSEGDGGVDGRPRGAAQGLGDSEPRPGDPEDPSTAKLVSNQRLLRYVEDRLSGQIRWPSGVTVIARCPRRVRDQRNSGRESAVNRKR